MGDDSTTSKKSGNSVGGVGFSLSLGGKVGASLSSEDRNLKKSWENPNSGKNGKKLEMGSI